MTLRLPLFLLICTFLSSLTAQLLPVENIDLSRLKATFPDLPVYVGQVVDVIGGDGTVGLAVRGEDDRRRLVRLVAKGGVEAAVHQTLAQPTDGTYADTAVLRISGLRTDEILGPSLALEAELLFPTAGGYDVYGPLRLTKNEGLLDLTPHARDIVNGVEELTRQLYNLRLKGPAERTITEAELRRRPPTYPIARADIGKLPDGVYASFMDFRAAAPDVSRNLQVAYTLPYHEEDGTAYQMASVRPNEGTAPRVLRQSWGIQKDGKAYLAIGKEYYELKYLEDGTLTVAAAANLFSTRPSATALTAIGSGAIPVALGKVADAFTIKADQYAKVFHVDLATGAIVDPDLPQPVVNVKGIVVESSDFNPVTHPVTISVNGRTGKLTPGNHAEIPRNTEVCFSVPGSAPDCTVLKADLGTAPTYYRLTVNKNGKFRFTWMPDDRARSVFHQLESGELPLIRLL